MIRLAIVNASLSESSSSQLLGTRLSEATVEALAAHDVDIAHIGLRELAHDVTNALLTGFPARPLAEAIEKITEADGIIAITPTYKAGMSGLFKSFFDITEQGALEGKPVLLGATGGTPRHSLMIDTAMRPLFSYLKADVTATGVFAATEDWGSGTESDNAPLDTRIARAGQQFAAHVLFTLGQSAVRNAAANHVAAREDDGQFGAGINFEDLVKQYT